MRFAFSYYPDLVDPVAVRMVVCQLWRCELRLVLHYKREGQHVPYIALYCNYIVYIFQKMHIYLAIAVAGRFDRLKFTDQLNINTF